MQRLFILTVLLWQLYGLALAQEAEVADAEFVVDESVLEANMENLDEGDIDPIITTPDSIELGQEILFDATSSKIVSLSNFGTPNYYWDFGDLEKARGEKVKHVFAQPGSYKVELVVTQGKKRATIAKRILVYTRKIVLITDGLGESLTEIEKEAAEKGILLQKIMVSGESSDLSVEDDFIRKFQENFDQLQEASSIIFYTNSTRGIQSFSQFWKLLSPDIKFDLRDKLIVEITQDSLDKIDKLTQPAFGILQPNFILLTRPEAMIPIFSEENIGIMLNQLNLRGIENQRVDSRSRISWLLPFSRLMNFFSSNGLSQTVIYILLSVPFLAFIIAFFRQFIGVSTFGVLAPLMLALAFLVLGLQFGLMVFGVVMLVSYAIRLLFDRVELLYIPKVSLLLSCLALSFFVVLGLAVYFGTSMDLSLTIFPMMVMSTFSEKFLSSQSSEGMRNAIVSAVETVFVAFVAFMFVTWEVVKDNVLATPELILLPILGTVWLGRFTGLRVSEYIKFRSLLNEDSQE